MKNNRFDLAAVSIELWYNLACQWEEEPEINDPWQRNTDI
jgi:hypothetical protein